MVLQVCVCVCVCAHLRETRSDSMSGLSRTHRGGASTLECVRFEKAERHGQHGSDTCLSWLVMMERAAVSRAAGCVRARAGGSSGQCGTAPRHSRLVLLKHGFACTV